MEKCRRIFLGWEKPLPHLAVQRLFDCVCHKIPADFSSFRILVPTAEAGRLLREAMAEYCPEGIIALDILMPDMLFRHETESPASQAAVLAAWDKTLANSLPENTEQLLGDKFTELQSNPEIRLAAGTLLQKCRKELAADGISVPQAVRIFRQCGMREQTERFELLEKLEKVFLRHCPDDPVTIQLQTDAPASDDRTIIVLHCPDLRGAAVRYLKNYCGNVEYWLHAPDELADTFDEYGRALPLWNKRDFPVNTAEQLRITIHTEDQVDILQDIHRNAGQSLRAIGVLDPALAEAWQDRLRSSPKEANPVFFPAMRPLSGQPWTRLFTSLLELRASSPTRETAAAILHHGFLADRQILAELDKIQKNTIAQDLVSLIRAAKPGKLKDALSQLATWQKQLTAAGNDVLSECWNILRSIGERPDCPAPDDRSSLAELTELESIITDAEHAAGSSPDLACAIFRQLCSSAQVRPQASGDETLDAVGFLELPWYGDTTITLAGFSENVMSGSRFSDPFLPEQAKKLLGMHTAERCTAADAFRFAALQHSVNLRFLLCRYGMRQDALKPPAILMRCPEKDLPQRIQDLFSDRYVLPIPQENKQKPDKLIPRRVIPEKRKLSVTDFSMYLRCPFTFYLQKILRTENADGKSIELDNAQSGTVLHNIIAACEDAVKSGKKAEDLFTCAEEQWKIARYRFGEPPPGLLDLQFAVMKDNLRYFAMSQEAWYQKGWRLIRSEKNPEMTAVPSCSWADFYHKVFPQAPRESWRETVEFNGRFDRLDVRINEENGERELCVIDYKTGSSKTPAEKHLCTATGLSEDEKCYRAVPESNKFWADLQLPLYVLMIRHLLPEEKASVIKAAYFNLPTAYASTGIYDFSALNEDLLQSAMRCADEVARRIYGPSPIFWPPRKYDNLFEPYEKLSQDDFDEKGFFLPPPEVSK